MTPLTRSETKTLAQKILKLVPIIQQKRFELLDEGKLTSEDFLAIASYERRLLDAVDDLSLVIFQEIMTDLNEPAKKLIQSTEDAQKAIVKIEETKKFIKIIQSFINLISAVILAVSLGTPIALISLVNELDNLVQVL